MTTIKYIIRTIQQSHLISNKVSRQHYLEYNNYFDAVVVGQNGHNYFCVKNTDYVKAFEKCITLEKYI